FFKLPESGVEVIYNGLNHSLYRPRDEATQARFVAEQGIDRPFLLFISRLEHPGKNHVRLIEAYEHYRKTSEDVHLLVLGGAPWHGAEVIQERVERSPYASDILMPGFIEEADLPLWYASADGLVFPSLIEGFGLPVVEAFACGLRVATSDRGSLPEVGGEAAIYFNPEDVMDISRAITALCRETEPKREVRITKGRVHAATFDWELAAKATCQSYLDTSNI
ncbi:MAG: glycosyltransferase family 4 protein, partial [Opitutales bacterium]